jgi:enhancer of polycomb-like protein
MDLDEDEDEENARRLSERWRYDMDDYPAVGIHGSDEQHRVLIDDYETK